MLIRIRYAVFALAILSGSINAFAQNGGQARPPKPVTATAVVDLDHIFDNHPTFQTQKEALKAEYQRTMEEFEARKKKFAQEVEALNSTLKEDSPEMKSKAEKLLAEESKLRFESMNKEKEFGERQAKLIFQTYTEVTKYVEFAATHYQYDLVVRYSRKQMSSMDPKKPNSVMMSIAEREVVYFNPDPHDLTEVVIGMLKRDLGQAQPTTAPATNQNNTRSATGGNVPANRK